MYGGRSYWDDKRSGHLADLLGHCVDPWGNSFLTVGDPLDMLSRV